jgi:hypothetical protein
LFNPAMAWIQSPRTSSRRARAVAIMHGISVCLYSRDAPLTSIYVEDNIYLPVVGGAGAAPNFSLIWSTTDFGAAPAPPTTGK